MEKPNLTPKLKYDRFTYNNNTSQLMPDEIFSEQSERTKYVLYRIHALPKMLITIEKK